jgi:hypothetical protein
VRIEQHDREHEGGEQSLRERSGASLQSFSERR